MDKFLEALAMAGVATMTAVGAGLLGAVLVIAMRGV